MSVFGRSKALQHYADTCVVEKYAHWAYAFIKTPDGPFPIICLKYGVDFEGNSQGAIDGMIRGMAKRRNLKVVITSADDCIYFQAYRKDDPRPELRTDGRYRRDRKRYD